jgi:hypothetical protein
MFDPRLNQGSGINNQELCAIFKCSPQGGMRKSNSTDTLVVISNHIKSIYLAVGTPVTQRPPHSPGRAVFPHPVPRLYSLSRKALALGKYPMSFGRYREFGLYKPKACYGSTESLPGKAFTLSTSSV